MQNHFPSLLLLKQTSLAEDTVTKNGVQKNVHVVVKNSPFCVTFGFNPSSSSSSSSALPDGVVNLHKYNLEVKLLYDSDAAKEVDFVKDKPFQNKSTINQSGNKITLEVRIKVLTSQLEDMLFRVAVFVYDSESNDLIFTVHSDPVKVISKSDQVKKKKSTSGSSSSSSSFSAPGGVTSSPPDSSSADPLAIFANATTGSGKNKRNIADLLSDSLSQIEATTVEHADALEKICENNDILLLERLQALEQGSCGSEGTSEKSKCPPPPDFASALKEFLYLYGSLGDVQTKRMRVSRLISTTADTQFTNFAELLDLLWAEGLSRDITEAPQHPQSFTQTSNHPTNENNNKFLSKE